MFSVLNLKFDDFFSFKVEIGPFPSWKKNLKLRRFSQFKTFEKIDLKPQVFSVYFISSLKTLSFILAMNVATKMEEIKRLQSP